MKGWLGSSAILAFTEYGTFLYSSLLLASHIFSTIVVGARVDFYRLSNCPGFYVFSTREHNNFICIPKHTKELHLVTPHTLHMLRRISSRASSLPNPSVTLARVAIVLLSETPSSHSERISGKEL